jgi:hypothetical protein
MDGGVPCEQDAETAASMDGGVPCEQDAETVASMEVTRGSILISEFLGEIGDTEQHCS